MRQGARSSVPERRIFGDETAKSLGQSRSRYRQHDFDLDEAATHGLTDQECHLVGIVQDFRGPDGRQMYVRVAAKRGPQLRRIGAIDHCIVYGMPDARPVLSFAHIHCRDAYFVLTPRLPLIKRFRLHSNDVAILPREFVDGPNLNLGKSLSPHRTQIGNEKLDHIWISRKVALVNW